MSAKMNPFEVKTKSADRYFMDWQKIYPRPYDKNEVDPYTRLRIILMNGTEYEATWFSHQFHRHCTNNDIRRELAVLRRTEQQQQKRIACLKPINESILETTIGYEQLAVDLTAILAQYDQHPEVQRMREFIQHGDVTTYQHCKNVVLVSWWLNHRLHLGADETSLAVGAFLHDFYLYDWHKKGTFHGIRRLFEMHGFSHPGCACVNAEKVFHITKKEQSIISSHMWPLTFRHVPSCREAIIVCLADKYCAVVESMFKRSRVAAAKNADGEYDEW